MIDAKYKGLNHKTILYVEDDVSLQKNIKEIFGHFFKEVLVAVDGDDAYTIYIENQNKIDVIITDINMPNTDGITFSKAIRGFDKSIPIVMVSAYTKTDYLLDSIDLNVIKYITKPLTTNKMMALLDKLLEHFKLNSCITITKHIQFDYEANTLWLNKKEIKLTSKESKFLKLLCEYKIVTYDMMVEYLWSYESSPTQNAIKTFIKKLKMKLPDEILKNQQGVGYFVEKS